ncbi:BspA family leucine-rich repeat surface protein [Enterococcus casseliflavus]|uniref:BspA family leucine-rich repeat surface protein n=1 Tax=Enterococcus casseliflavus TaxID=37734 RepID=UPI001AD7A7DF|nr:BspA family leucine-rich repeat surface protein [Enterococcus casseliflavus]MBO6359609.1 BspA family leucine-rich repeat surface protein [Enterococcus casseliflavus]MBO6377699.1 BspA family leucine-rich repeat surface protein [Enterococcus casseliflavus]
MKKITTFMLVAPMILFSMGYKTQAQEMDLVDQYSEQIEEVSEGKFSKQRSANQNIVGVKDGWIYGIQEESNVAELILYVGNPETINIPAEVAGKQTMIDLDNLTGILECTNITPEQVKSIRFIENNGKKVIPGHVTVDWAAQKQVKKYNTKLNFEVFKNLEQFDGRGLDTSHMTDFRSAFAYSKQLKSVNLDNIDTSQVTNMSYMFTECQKLADIQLANWDTRNVREMQQMFFDCQSLDYLDISSFSTPRLNKMEFMFARSGASVIRLDNFSMSSVYELNKFGIFDNTPNAKELLITTNDTQLLNYNYAGRVPYATPKLNANGGIFSDGKAEKTYFERCAVTPSQLDSVNFETFKNSNIPTKEGYNFLGWTEKEIEKDNTGVLELLNKEYQAEWQKK